MFASRVAKVRGPWGWGTAFFDYDNDGWPVLLVNSHVYAQVDNIDVDTKYAQRILLFHNNGDSLRLRHKPAMP